MKFSIIIPYKDKGNNEKFLWNCIDSLQKQIFTDFEVLFIHNKPGVSADLDVGELNVIGIEMDDSALLSDYRNKGIERANGEFIVFLDADDYLHPNALIYAKHMIDADIEHVDVFKFGISETSLDKISTMKKNKQAFFGEEPLPKLESVLNEVNIQVNQHQINQIMYGLFEKEIIQLNYESIKVNQSLKKLNYRYRAHSFIIRTSFLRDHDITFKSENNLYSDIPFLFELYNNVQTIKQTKTKLYYKYLHNDPINSPSLSQEEHGDRMLKRLQAYNESLAHCENLYLAKQIKLTAVKFYLYKIVTSEEFNRSYKEIKPLFLELNSILNKPSEGLKLSKRHSYEINAIKKGNFKTAHMFSKVRDFGYKTHQFTKSKNQRFRQKKIQKNLFAKLPIKNNTILYESFLGRNYSDSPKAIFNYLLEKDSKKWKHVWVLNDKDLVKDEKEFNNKNVKIIKRFGWKYFYYITVSKYFVLNMRQPKWLSKKDDQVILSTWHGTPLKRLVFDMENVTSANKNYKKDFYDQSRNWDYLIAANKYSQSIFESAFMYPSEKILTYGYPRNDILKNHSKEYKNQIKDKLGIPTSKKAILYAPTWRDDEYHSAGNYKFNLKLDLKRMQKEFGDEYVIILRMHYFISDNMDLSGYEGFAFDCSKYNDINDLYIASDMLITDYSSVFFDFANLRKPILFYTYDVEKYQSMLRGFYIDVYNDLPGPLLMSNDDIVESIKNIEEVNNNFKNKYEAFYNEYCNLEDGQATKRVVEKVFEHK